MPKQIATWNSARDVWETRTTGLFCEHSDVFSATWPTSGTTRAGTAYVLPTSAPRTDGSASSSLPVLPTPRATDGTNGGPNQRGSSGDLMLPSAVTHLLPTPACNDMGEGKTVQGWDEWTATMQAKHGNGNGHGKSLAIEAQRLLPTPMVCDPEFRSEASAAKRLKSGFQDIFLALTYGASTPPPSTDGNTPSDEQHPPQQRQDPKADND